MKKKFIEYENNMVKYEYSKEFDIEEALKMASEFREWLNKQIVKHNDKLITTYSDVDIKALRKVFNEGKTHADLGN